MTTENEKEQPQKAYGLLAEYKNTTELVNAATKVRDAGLHKVGLLLTVPGARHRPCHGNQGN